MLQRIKGGAPSFPDGQWRDISASARDLVSLLLSPDPHQRPSPTLILRHPWLHDRTAGDDLPLPSPAVLSTAEATAWASGAPWIAGWTECMCTLACLVTNTKRPLMLKRKCVESNHLEQFV